MTGSRAITLQELDRMIAVTPNARDRALLLLAAATGARANELAQAMVSSVMTGDRRLTGILELRRSTTKGKKRSRSIQMAPRAKAALAAWLAQHPAPHLAAPLWPAIRAPHGALGVRQIERIVSDAARRAGVAGKVTPHSLRKLYGTRAYEISQQDIAMTADALGHINPTSTMRYLDLNADRRAAVLTQILGDPSSAELGDYLPFDHVA